MFFVFLLLIMPITAIADEKPTPDDYWRLIRKAAQSAYSGMDIEFSVNTSYQFEGENRGPAFGVSVPLYSKKEKLRRRSEVVKFQQEGAELIQKLETAISQAKIFKDASKFLQARFEDEGVAAVTAYYDQLAKIAEQEAMITQYHRELQSLILPFSGKDEINIKDIVQVSK